MEQTLIIEILDKLKDGSLNECFVKRDEFLSFRAVLVERPDFKYFQGIAQRGGDVIFKYLKEPRS